MTGSNDVMVRYLIFGLITIFGTFSLQHILLKEMDSFIISFFFQFEPVISLVIAMIYGIQEFEILSLLIYLGFLCVGHCLIVVGIRQFEDKYEGGILGFSSEQTDHNRVEHFRELELLGLDNMSDIRSKA
jgi:hypothetical protein